MKHKTPNVIPSSRGISNFWSGWITEIPRKLGMTMVLMVVLAGGASASVKLAEKEICRYVYLRTGKLQPCPVKLNIDPALGAQEYRITADSITGGSDIGVLYGAYRYAELLGVLNEVVCTNNPANDSLANVVGFLSDYTADFVSPTGIKSRLHVPMLSELPEASLSTPARHNLLLAAKEALNNAVRHAQTQTISLKMEVAAGWLVVVIADYGHGFDLNHTRPGGNGLVNIQSRMKAIGGRSEIRSQPGHGTTVTLSLPLPETSRQAPSAESL